MRTHTLWVCPICSRIFLKSSKSCRAVLSPSAIRLQLSPPPPTNWMPSSQVRNSWALLVGAWHCT